MGKANLASIYIGSIQTTINPTANILRFIWWYMNPKASGSLRIDRMISHTSFEFGCPSASRGDSGSSRGVPV